MQHNTSEAMVLGMIDCLCIAKLVIFCYLKRGFEICEEGVILIVKS